MSSFGPKLFQSSTRLDSPVMFWVKHILNDTPFHQKEWHQVLMSAGCLNVSLVVSFLLLHLAGHLQDSSTALFCRCFDWITPCVFEETYCLCRVQSTRNIFHIFKEILSKLFQTPRTSKVDSANSSPFKRGKVNRFEEEI